MRHYNNKIQSVNAGKEYTILSDDKMKPRKGKKKLLSTLKMRKNVIKKYITI